MRLNPFEPPRSAAHHDASFLAADSSIAIVRRTIFAFFWWRMFLTVALAFVTDFLNFDCLAISISIVCLVARHNSARALAVIVLLCGLYPLGAVVRIDGLAIGDMVWLPTRENEGLVLEAISIAWSGVVMFLIFRILFSNRPDSLWTRNGGRRDGRRQADGDSLEWH